jgi:hypothetical protein
VSNQDKAAMRASIVLGVALIAGCSSPRVRCDQDLTPINPPQHLSGDPPSAVQTPSRLEPSQILKTPESGPGTAPPSKSGDAP